MRAGYKGRSLGSFVPKVTRNVFEKFGFATATLLPDWATIVGPDLAARTAPECLKWPRGVGTQAKAGDGGHERAGATLLLRVEPAHALDVSYRSHQLIDRINAYFGYRAVEALRFVQAPIGRQTVPAIAAVSAPVAGAEAGVSNDPLDVALASLGANIAGERHRQAIAQLAG